MRALLLLVALSSLAAVAQEDASPPPVMPAEDAVEAAPAPEPAPREREVSYLERCFAVPAQVWVPMPSGRYVRVSGARAQQPLSTLHPAVPADAPVSAPGGAPAGPSGGDGLGKLGDGKAFLIVAVVLVAALPIILYVLDESAPAAVEQRYWCPSLSVDLVGGVEWRGSGWAAGSVRATFGYGPLGADFQYDLSGAGINAWATHLMARLPPRRIITPNLAFGFRSMTLGGVTRAGFEAGVPHRYTFSRDGLREVSLELRPTLMFGLGALDVGLEGALLIPVVEPLHVRLGARVQTFGEGLYGGAHAGITLAL
jgi:hypothetical protein